MISVLIVDDHQIFRDGLRMLLDSTDDIVVIGEAESGADALARIAEEQPTLVLMDIQMPEENGIEITRRIKEQYPDIIVLMLTMFEDDQSVFAAMRAGAVGYVLKGIKHQDMLQTVRVAAAGGAVFSPRIARHMMQWFERMQGADQPAPTVAFPELSRREQEVIAMIAAGDDNATIAEKLTVTPKTVRNYVSQVLKKLAVSDRAAAAEKARQAGIK
jgi:DNA-binding NarL/FixJ family response regulator